MIVHSLSTDARPSDSITEAIVDAVNDVENCDPLTLPPLWDVIDPEALDELFAPTRRGRPRTGHVGFVYAGHEVTVAVDVLGSEVPASQSEAAASDDGDETISVSLESLA